ncbi:RAB6A-GEF complex partner protein 2 [Culicoides brevitarsis]|uniref:RAB6A-GEF complex partner protein 2 n=1 Tax=Culicoides brevitarsis TaxID=469753 RepID=UPI00307C5E55
MIEIKARLVREQTAVFIAGESIECFVTFTNPQRSQSTLQSNSDVLENLAWATVSIQCYCNTTLKKDKPSLADDVPTASTSLATSLLKQGTLVASAQPKFLFCDLRLEPGETKSYLYRDELPKKGPPTYRGVRVKYFYKITIATQRVGSKVQLLNVPVRVLPKPDFENESVIGEICDDTNDNVAPANPFIEKKKTESYLEIILHYLQNISSRRCPNFYVITNKRGRVGRFCLFKQNYKLGEDIVGTLDFSSQTVKCVQYSVTLQCEEIIRETNGDEVHDVAAVTSFTKHHEVCIGLVETQIILPVPLHVTPSFKTDQVDVRWRLHFQFVTTTSSHMTPECEPGETWQAPEDIEIETMMWNLNVQVLPTNPLQISAPSGVHTLIIK